MATPGWADTHPTKLCGAVKRKAVALPNFRLRPPHYFATTPDAMAEPFRLQSVLRLRVSLQDERQAELAQAVQADQILHEQTRDVETRLVEIESQLREAAQQHLDLDHLMSLRRFQTDTRGLLLQLQEQRQQVEQEIERRQGRLAEARREVQVIETLEQHHRQEQQAKQLQREQHALDEFAQKRTAT